MKVRANIFVSIYIRLVIIYGIWLLVFLLGRIIFLTVFGEENIINNHFLELSKAFIIGYRTDTMAISYFLLIPYLLSFIFLFIHKDKLMSYKHKYNTFFMAYGIVMTLVIVFGIIADFFFYVFFSDHFNILVFDIFKDDTKAVLISMWKDYPLIKISLALVFVYFLSKYILKRINKTEIQLVDQNNYARVVFSTVLIVFTSLILFFTAMRNSWGSSPLKMENTGVSTNIFINKVGLNCFYCLQHGIQEYLAQKINTDIDETILKSGFNNEEEIYFNYSGKKDSSIMVETPYNEFLTNNPPNIVFVQMESMSQYLMEYHSKELNLYGELENHLPEIYYFKNFVSSGITTINTLEEILINSPVHPISQSSYREKNIPNNVVFQFKKKGYQTIFITGGRLAWRNLENYLYKQDFEIVEGDKAIENAISGTSQSEWGIFDEFVFERAFNLLNIDTIKPKFVYIMTTTNHTPFKVPKTYKPYPVSMNESFKQKLKIDTALSKKELIAFQYANNCLGNFINKLRSSKPGENTIVVITGDHTRPNFFNFYNEEIYKNYAVPLLVFIPQKYKPDFEIDTNRFGSHKDIFPTIFNLALSKTTYLKSGNNLFTPLNDTTYFYGISNSNAGISKDGVYFADKNLFLSWKDTSYSRLIINPNLNLSDRLNNKIRAHSALMEIILKSELLKE